MGNNQTTEPLVQSVALKGTEKDGYSAIYRSTLVSDKELVTSVDPNVRTLHENFFQSVKKHADRPCLGVRQVSKEGISYYEWQTYGAVGKQIVNFASGLIHLGAKQADNIGIFSKNRPEWVVAEQACYAQSMIPVALYDTLGPDSVAYIVNHAEIKVVICTQDKLAKLIDILETCPTLKTLIQIESEGNKELIEKAQKKGVKLISFAEVSDNGGFNKVDINPPKFEDLSTVMYTSETTGVPKGVMLTHGNVISALSSGQMMFPMYAEDVLISFLPMAHIFERVIQGIIYGNGASVGFYSGDVQKLFEDMEILKPTILPGVPRLFSRMFQKVMAGKDQKGGISKFLFDLGYSSKQAILEEGQDASGSFWNSIVFDKIREKFGNRLRLVVTGAAPITKDVFQFLQIGFSCPIIQGYGLTETTATGGITWPSNVKPGHCGPPNPCLEIRLQDVPDMKYFSTDKPCPRGEICIRGNSVFQGYFKNPEQTKEAFDDDGFFHTGDIGQINSNGTMSVIDRKKNIFKLAHGEYVAVEHLEGVFGKNKFVGQLFVYGDSTQPALVAVLVPDADSLTLWGKENKVEGSFKELCQNERVQKMLLDELTKTGKEAKLLGYELIKAMHVEGEAFSVENDLLTPTFKLKRPQLKDKYLSVINNLYANMTPMN